MNIRVMRQSMLYSLIFHSTLLMLLLFGLPFLNYRSLEIPQPIPVEFVPISSETMAPAPKLKPLPKPPEPVPEPPKPEEPTPPEPEPVPTPPEPTPEPPKPEVKPDLPPEPKKEDKPIEKPKEEDKPKPPEPPEKPKDKPKPKNDLSAILKNLEKKKDSRKNEDQVDKKSSKDAAEEQQVGKIGDKSTMSEMDAIRQQISKCWNIPAGARDAKDLIVEVRVKVEPDGVVREVKIVDRKPAVGTETFYKAAQESARRAVIQCSPLKLPPEKYDIWKDFTLTFNPKDIL